MNCFMHADVQKVFIWDFTANLDKNCAISFIRSQAKSIFIWKLV